MITILISDENSQNGSYFSQRKGLKGYYQGILACVAAGRVTKSTGGFVCLRRRLRDPGSQESAI